MPVGLPTERLRIAQILVALGPERASDMLRKLPQDQVKSLAGDMATVDMTPEETRDVLKDFTREFLRRQAAPAGLDTAKRVLTNLYGDEEADRVARDIDPQNIQPFAWMAQMEPSTLAKGLENEPPATIAVALAHLQPGLSARLLRKIKDPKRSDVAMRVASLHSVAPDVVQAIDKNLRDRVAGGPGVSGQTVEGVNILVEVLSQSSPKIQKSIVESIREHDDKLAVQIQEQLFVFDDIAMLDDRAVQQVLKSIETMDLAFALYSSPEEIQDLIFRNLSERARDSLKEEIDYLQSPKPAEMKAAKGRIVAVVRELEESGAIDIERPGVDDDDDDDDEEA
jgi:flagellar motor switch protein FliG